MTSQGGATAMQVNVSNLIYIVPLSKPGSFHKVVSSILDQSDIRRFIYYTTGDDTEHKLCYKQKSLHNNQLLPGIHALTLYHISNLRNKLRIRDVI